MNTRFTEFFINENGPKLYSFKRWIFLPDMLFNSHNKWWGNCGKRPAPHEGLDLCLYQDHEGRIHHLDHSLKIPAMLEGKVINIFEDFLGRSIIIEHGSRPEKVIYVFYGHTIPRISLRIGDFVAQGTPVGTISGPKGPNCKILPHLHISVGQSQSPVSKEELVWEKLAKSRLVQLLDPINFIEYDYAVMENSPFHL